MERRWMGFLICLPAILLALVAYPVAASPAVPPWGGFVNGGAIPPGSVLVLDITHKVTNDEDSGICGYWALDNYEKHVQVWLAPDGTFYAVARYVGTWQTFLGVPSAQSCTPQSTGAFGTFQGGYFATFTATGFTSAFGNIGTFDYGGTQADILLGTYGAGQTGPTTPFSFLATYFTGVSGFTYIDWGWTYHYRGQTWNNFASGNSGDIVA